MGIAYRSTVTEQISDVLEKVGELDGIKGLRLGAEGAASLRLNGNREVIFEYAAQSGLFFLYTPLLSLPPDAAGRATLMRRLLSSNFLKLQSHPGVWAVDADRDSVIYQIAVDPAALTVQVLDTYIEVLVNQHLHAADLMQPDSRRPPPRPVGGPRVRTAVERRLVSSAANAEHDDVFRNLF